MKQNVSSKARMFFRIAAAAWGVMIGAGCKSGEVGEGIGGRSMESTAEERAIEFLAKEVPAWSRENGCFSCHNNGDGARALMVAAKNGEKGRGALEDTLEWLKAPEKWDENKGDPSASDRQLADLQFAFAVLGASEAGLLTEFESLEKAARRIARHQARDGSWQVEPQNPAGSPVTYGTTLATYVGWRILAVVPEDPALDRARKRAGEWLEKAETGNIPGAAALLMFLVDSGGAPQKRERLARFLEDNQLKNGGWGPYPQSPAEVYDTALAVLALRRANAGEEAMRKGQAYLREQQREDGSWAATTRPTGGESYAQQISTSGWAALALMKER